MAFSRTTEGNQPYIQPEPSSQGKFTVAYSFHTCTLQTSILQMQQYTHDLSCKHLKSNIKYSCITIIITAFRIHVLRWKMAADSTVLEMFDGGIG